MIQRMSRLFGGTVREVPTAIDAPGQQLLVRAGMLRQAAPGRMVLLPLGQRVLERVVGLLDEALAAAGAQPWQLPQQLTPLQTAQLIGRELRSYRQLPLLLTLQRRHEREDVRARGGLLQLKEYRTLDCYAPCADAQWAALLEQQLLQLISAVLQTAGLPVFDARAAVRQLVWPTLLLGESWLECSQCGTRMAADQARFERNPQRDEAPLALTEIATPATPTIDALAQYLGVPATRTGKAIMLTAQFADGDALREQFVFVVVRGDREVSLPKVQQLIGAAAIRPATADEISAHGAAAGYAGPIGLQGALIVADEEAALSPNLVMGANRAGYHLQNVNLYRDYLADHVGDVCRAREGDRCLQCGIRYETVRAIETARIGRISGAGLTILNEQGAAQAAELLHAQIGLERLLGCLAEAHHDEQGLRWPVTVAPYQLQLVVLAGKDAAIGAQADALAEQLDAAGIELLYDDRDERAGVKFADADLIGLPLRLTLSRASLAAGGVELKARDADERTVVPLGELIDVVTTRLNAAYEALGVMAPFGDLE
jgi:prolyl-tRNA synthetase